MSENYGVAMTKQGLALIARIIASRANLTLVRVMMGSGTVPEGTYIGDLEDLVEPVVPGTVSDPIYKGSTVEMTVEYRSDMNGGLQEGFIIREFGIFARDGDEEIMILYGNLAERQQYIGPWVEGGGNDIRRYPVSITVAEGTKVILDGLPGTVMTIDDVKDYCVTVLLPQLLAAAREQIVAHNQSELAHPYLQEKIKEAMDAATNAAEGAKDAEAAAANAQETADRALAAAAASPGGCAVRITFGPGCAGWNYQITDGEGELYAGIVPDSLTVEVTLKQCATEYTVTAWDGEGNTWTNKLTTGPYFGPGEITVTEFSAVLTVKSAASALVTAACDGQKYTATANEDGEAELVIGTAGEYTVTAAMDGKTVSGFVDIAESKSYRLELGAFREDINAEPVARSHIVFEPEDWTDTGDGVEMRVARDVHGLEAKQSTCVCTIRHRIGRTARDYSEQSAAKGRASITAAVAAALDANASAPGAYPTAEDGHIQLTWDQVQHYILEGFLLPAGEAAAEAEELGFDWRDRDTTGATETATLDAVLGAAYLPALGGVTTGLDALCTAQVLQGLRLRRKEDGVLGSVDRYDLDGKFFTDTWSARESLAFWDVDSGDLIVQTGKAYAGDLLVMG